MADSPTRVGHTDSIASQESGGKPNDKKKKSRRPANTAFRQQRLKAWQPILTPKTVLPLFFSIGIIFAPIGGLLLYASSQVQEISIDYTTCYKDAPNNTDSSFDAVPSANVFSQFKNNTDVKAQWRRETVDVPFDGVTSQTQKCMVQFSVPEDMGPPVLFFYRLGNFYQNHRRYVDSFFDKQLAGKPVTTAQIKASKCTPLFSDDSGKPYYPCGLIANSIFNDTFFSPYAVGAKNTPYNMSEKGIAWDSDKQLIKNISAATPLDSIAVPPNWQKRWPNGYTKNHPPPNIGDDEHFMVWMRTAGLPDFSKLYMRNDSHALVKGTYQVDILDWFPAHAYKGTKSIVLSTRTVMGGRNNFLGIAYLVVGGLCILLGAIFAVTHLLKPRKLGDHTYLSWNNTPSSKHPAGSSAAMASGRDLGPTGGV